MIVEATATDTLVERNLVIGSGDDGIDVDNPRTTLSRNIALHNGDLGIEAVPGVTDGGGNKAHANGNRAQCTNVACNSAMTIVGRAGPRSARPASRWLRSPSSRRRAVYLPSRADSPF